MNKQWVFLLILALFVTMSYMLLPRSGKQQYFEYVSGKNDSAYKELIMKEYRKKAQKEYLKQYLRVI